MKTAEIYGRGVSTMKIAICDDEREICEGLERLIRKQRAEAEVVLFSDCAHGYPDGRDERDRDRQGAADEG